MIDKFKLRFWKLRAKFKDLLQAEAESESPKAAGKLPADMALNLSQALINLPSHASGETAVDALNTALVQWRENINAPNSLVILGAPVMPLSRILSDTIGISKEENILQVRTVQWEARPHEYANIQNYLKNEINSELIIPEKEDISDTQERLEARNSLVVISRLDWCFLRCIGGFEGIEFIRNIVFAEQSCFWLIGCNTWAWQYLDFIYQVSAYLGSAVSLPNLSGEELQEWLKPVVEGANVEFGDDGGSEDGVSQERELYFEQLAGVSQGMTSVAAALWLRSLRYEAPVPDADGATTPKLKLDKPNLPDLPNLLSQDHYLLYSLLLHGGMSLAHLAASMGKSISAVKPRVQFLLQSGVIEREQNLLGVNPAHYPKLKIILDTNNFLVGK